MNFQGRRVDANASGFNGAGLDQMLVKLRNPFFAESLREGSIKPSPKLNLWDNCPRIGFLRFPLYYKRLEMTKKKRDLFSENELVK